MASLSSSFPKLEQDNTLAETHATVFCATNSYGYVCIFFIKVNPNFVIRFGKRGIGSVEKICLGKDLKMFLDRNLVANLIIRRI